MTSAGGARADLPAAVQGLVDAYLADVDGAADGLVEGLYVTGSIALGDYQPSISDVDLVAVCRARPTAADVTALAAIHRPSRPSVDVLYATRDDLVRDPSAASLPCSILGEFKPGDAFVANPVEWRVLATHAVAVRGEQLDPRDVWFDADALRRWNLANLDGYWANWVERGRARDATEGMVRFEYGLQWLVLGVPRLHHTIATLAVTSKTGAGSYALDVVPAHWYEVVRTAMALRVDRATDLPAAPEVLWRDGLDLAAWLIDDAHRLVEVTG